MPERLFVYGTLRRHGARPIEDDHRDVRFEETGKVSGKLYDLGDYPGILLSASGGVVRGEIYAVDDAALVALDLYEGLEYRRVLTDVHLDGGRVERCWIYELLETPANHPIIPGGDWMERGIR